MFLEGYEKHFLFYRYYVFHEENISTGESFCNDKKQNINQNKEIELRYKIKDFLSTKCILWQGREICVKCIQYKKKILKNITIELEQQFGN